MTPSRRVAGAALAAALVAVLTACSATPTAAGTQSATAPTGAESADATQHNAADAEFAQMMIVHHEGAIEMAELASSAAATDEVRALAQRIAAAQGPEIEQMSGWLDAWGEAQPADAQMDAMGHEGMDMDGMDQQAAMDELSALSGADFDRRFLELMIEHHRGAIVMAETERGAGENTDAIQLAGAIIDAQTAEITEMSNLLGEL